MNTWFARLPPELILSIMDRIDVLDLPAFICSNYPLLRHNNIAPQLSTLEVAAMRQRTLHGPPFSRAPLPRNDLPLPPELWLPVSRNLSLDDKISFAVATWWLRWA